MTQSTIKDVLLQCQEGMKCHTKLIKSLKKILGSMGEDAFWAEFEQLIKFPMSVYNREPTVERTIDFIAKFATASGSTPATEAPDQEPDTESGSNPLLARLFDFLLQHHSAKDRAVRFRACQLVTKLLGCLGEEASIEDDLYDRVFHAMLERLRDRSALVRVHAVLALVRLQDPADETCPVIKAYIFLMTCDPNPEVRKTIVSHIAPCRKTLQAILERTSDVKDTVRQAAYTVIAEKIPLKALSISQRVQLLQQGLNDRTESVKTVCSSKMLQSWLRGFQGNVLELLHSLDVESSVDVCRQMLLNLFQHASVADLVADFNLLDDNYVVPRDKLTSESSMYWRELCQFVHKAGTDYEQHLDTILPPCLTFCTYLDSVVSELDDCQDLDRQLDVEFIVQQLLHLFICMDLTDQACRNAVGALLHKLLLSESVSFSLVVHVLPCLRPLHPSTDSLVTYLAETVAEIRQPITTVERSVNAEARRKIDLKVAKVRVDLNQVREELEECVQRQEFQRAAELKESVGTLEAERSALLNSAQPCVEEVKTEKNDPVTVVKCLTIICEMMETLPLQTLTPTLHMLMENQILPSMSSEEVSVRNLAVKAIGMCCTLKRDIIQLHLPVLLMASQVDVHCVQVTAVKSLFDLIHVYGLGAFVDPSTSDDKADDASDDTVNEADNSVDMLDTTRQSQTAGGEEKEEDGDEGTSKTASNLITILSSMLDNEGGELRSVVAEGLAKLLMSGRVFSAPLLSRLLLLWYNPLLEEDAMLRHTLGTFFPVFAFIDSANQQLFDEAFLPTLRTLVNAPTTSPLNSVDPSNVADFLVQLTHARHLVAAQTSNTALTDNPCHDSIALKVCNEILSHPQSFQLRVWTRVLNQLQLSPDNHTHLKHLAVLNQQMLQAVKERVSVKALEKFHSTVDQLLGPFSTVTEGDSAATATGDATLAADRTTTDWVDSEGKAATPCMPPPVGAAAKSTGRRVRSKRLNSQLDMSQWTTPAQPSSLDQSGADSGLENVRSNLDSLLLDGAKTPNNAKVPRTPGSKRVLHTIQDPALL